MSKIRGFADYANVSPIVGVIVARGMATIHELETVYSYEDALNMSEIITVQNYNEWISLEEAKRGNGS